MFWLIQNHFERCLYLIISSAGLYLLLIGGVRHLPCSSTNTFFFQSITCSCHVIVCMSLASAFHFALDISSSYFSLFRF